eukprot:UN17759
MEYFEVNIESNLKTQIFWKKRLAASKKSSRIFYKRRSFYENFEFVIFLKNSIFKYRYAFESCFNGNDSSTFYHGI